MNPRLAALAPWCRDIVLPALVIFGLAALGAGGIENSGATPIVSRLAPALAANVAAVEKVQPVAANRPDAVTAAVSTAPAVAETTSSSQEPQPIVTAALTPSVETSPAPAEPASVVSTAAAAVIDQPPPAAIENNDAVTATGSAAEAEAGAALPSSTPEAPVKVAMADPSEVLPTQTPAEQTAIASTPSQLRDPNAIDSAAVLDECFVVDSCVDRYLWALYERTPKEDSVRESDSRKVTVKRKGKLVTVTKTFSTVTDEDFAWKDRKAADRAGMSLMDYVIGGIDRGFKMRLFQMLHAAEEAGLTPGITSAFRDDYRQSIASGLKAANDRSYHGGSSHGGYGHGLAADIVSVNGDTRTQRLASTENFWKWVDAHGPQFGIGRPYLDRDPPHVGPIDGKEYADHRGGMKTRQASRAPSKVHKTIAVRENRGPAKHAARSSKVRAS